LWELSVSRLVSIVDENIVILFGDNDGCALALEVPDILKFIRMNPLGWTELSDFYFEGIERTVRASVSSTPIEYTVEKWYSMIKLLNTSDSISSSSPRSALSPIAFRMHSASSGHSSAMAR
jgi:hypothetical protein